MRSVVFNVSALIALGTLGFTLLLCLIGVCRRFKSGQGRQSSVRSIVSSLYLVLVLPAVLMVLFTELGKTQQQMRERKAQNSEVARPPYVQGQDKANVAVEKRAGFIDLPPVTGGHYKSYDDAYQDALEQLRNRVAVFLEDQGLEYQPSIQDVKKLVRNPPQTVPFENPLNIDDMNDMKSVVLQMSLTEHDYNKFKQKDRALRAHQRVAHLCKFGAGLVVLLLTIGGYVRLDELSKGYYSGWLRLGAAVATAAVFAGLATCTF